MSYLANSVTEVSKAMQDTISKGEILKYSANIVEIGQFFKMVGEERSRLEKLVEILKSIENEYSVGIIPFMLDANKLDNFSIGGRKFQKSARVFASIVARNEVAGFEWLRAEGYGPLIKTTVHPKSLSSAMTAYILDKGKMPPDNTVSCFIQEYTSVKKDK